MSESVIKSGIQREVNYGTRKQKEIRVEAERKASKIEAGYKKRGVSSKEAERRA